MAKRKESADVTAKTDTKKLKQVANSRAGGPKTQVSGNGVAAEAITKKSKPRSRASKGSDDPSTKTTSPSTKTTSKYFTGGQAVKEEPDTMSEDGDVIIIPSGIAGSVVMKAEKKEEGEEEESDEDEDWEEVEELAEPVCPVGSVEPPVPSQPVEIEIETPDIARKREKKEKRKAEFEAYLRRMMNRFNKDVIEDTHKVHLLCLLANGIFRNCLCSEPDLLAITLSLVPAHFTMVTPERMDTLFLIGLLKWFGVTFTLNPALPEEQGAEPRAVLERRLGSLSARDHQEMTHLFLLVLRSLQLFCRLVLSLQPLPLRPPPAKGKAKTSSSPPEPRVSPGGKRPARGSGGGKGERGGKKQRKRDGGEIEGGGARPKNTTRRSVASKVSYKEDSSEGEGPSEEEEFQLTSGGESDDSAGGAKAVSKNRKRKEKGKGRAPRRSSGVKKKEEVKSEEEDEEEEEVEVKKERRKEGKGADEWLEVYLEKAGRWVCLDVDQGVGQAQQCSNQATRPLSYVVGIDGDGYLKDLSSKYDPTWLTSSRKRRVDPEWWEETLEFYECPDSERERQETKELQDKLLDKPLPTAISEFKNHPLYSLKRHLLKYEAVYPSTAAILGYCRGDPVYSRDCIHTLHSRDTWLKEARTVCLGEEPYKMVKGFSNRSRKARMLCEQKEQKDLPLFGEWQTEEYQPPVAVDGKVPRNDFGNVYLFKPCMLPVGCVHVRLPNLNRVARKLDLDCALAVTGFDFHGGYSHAVTDGYIVCEEHQEILRAAWENEQEILQQKAKEKREKRAVVNWTLLVKSLLIRERLKRRYGQQGLVAGVGLGQEEEGERGGLSSGEEEGGGSNMAPPTLASSWPQNRLGGRGGGGGRS